MRSTNQPKFIMEARAGLPCGWSIEEEKSRCARGVTFCLFLLHVGWPTAKWPVVLAQPRHVTRKIAAKVAANGLWGVVCEDDDPVTKVYTAEVTHEGFSSETTGLREALMRTDPSFYTLIDSLPGVKSWAYKLWPDKPVPEDGYHPKLPPDVRAAFGSLHAEEVRGGVVVFEQRCWRAADFATVPKSLPEGAVPLHFKRTPPARELPPGFKEGPGEN